jgi:hypothetical protein
MNHRLTCHDGLCRKVYVGVRIAGDIFDSAGGYVVGASLVLPQQVGVDMRADAERAAASGRAHTERRVNALADAILGMR